MKRLWLLFLVAAVMLAIMPTLSGVAQGQATATPRPNTTPQLTTTGNPPPAIFNETLTDLGKRLGRTITLFSFENTSSSWTWEPRTFADTGLECPAAGLVSRPVATAGYVFTLVLNGVTYEYRAAVNDRNSLILCSSTNSRIKPGPVFVTASSTPGASVNAPIVSTPAPGVCPDNLPGRLRVGAKGRVTPGLANRIRADGSYGAAIIGRIPAGEVFDVIGGPKCDGGSRFWQVTYQGITGWTAEGLAGVYWLEPVQ